VKLLSKNILLNKFSLLWLSALFFILALVLNKLNSNRSSVIQEVRVAEKYLHQTQKDFDKFLKDSALIKRLLYNNESLDEFSGISNKKYSIFIYSTDSSGQNVMKFWNNQLVTPSPGLLAEPDGEYFSQYSNGWYFAIKKTFAKEFYGDDAVLYAMIPVRSEFFIETDYLPKEFVYSKVAGKRVSISEKITEFPVKSSSARRRAGDRCGR